METQKNISKEITYIELIIRFSIDKTEHGLYKSEYAKESDFEGIYQIFRQRDNHKVWTEFYNQWLEEYLIEKVSDYKDEYRIEDYDLELLFTIDSFIKWLKTRKDVYGSPFTHTTLFKVFDDHEKSGSGIWGKIGFTPFVESFEGKGNKIMIEKRNQVNFCKILGAIEKERDRKIAPNMAVWVEKTFGITQYKNQK